MLGRALSWSSLSFVAVLAACSGTNSGSAADAGPTTSDGGPGPSPTTDGGPTTDDDAATKEDAAKPDAAPDNTPRFVLTLGGKSITPATLTTSRSGSDINIKAAWDDGTLVDPDFTVTFEDTFAGTSKCDNDQKAKYHRWTGSSEVYEYTATGSCNMNIARNGTDGFVEGSVTGSFNPSGTPIPFSVSFTQPIAAK
jgi:hypothetical protein